MSAAMNAKLKAYRRTRRGVLTVRYSDMFRRTKGKLSGDGKTCPWKGLPCMPRGEFLDWALSDSEFECLFVQWQESGFQRRCAPSVNRIDRFKGYTLDNVEWVTQQQNSQEALAIGRQTRQAKKAAKEVLVAA